MLMLIVPDHKLLHESPPTTYTDQAWKQDRQLSIDLSTRSGRLEVGREETSKNVSILGETLQENRSVQLIGMDNPGYMPRCKECIGAGCKCDRGTLCGHCRVAGLGNSTR